VEPSYNLHPLPVEIGVEVHFFVNFDKEKIEAIAAAHEHGI
jgi:hypothetical protein